MTDSPLGFTPQQIAAIDQVVAWYKSGKGSRQVFKLFGYAGTGKTTLAKVILAQLLGVDVYFVAPTGKAASVLTSKGCPATTVHHLIYKCNGRKGSDLTIAQLQEKLKQTTDKRIKAQYERRIKQLEQPTFTLKTLSALADADPTCTLIILDEASMVGRQMGEDLIRFRIKILVLGDPAQLPPVGEKKGYFMGGNPQVILREVHRSEGNPVLTELAQEARTKPLPISFKRGNCKSLQMLPAAIKPHHFKYFDQILVHTNKRKQQMNRAVRTSKGLGWYGVVVGERLVCRKTNPKLGVINGDQYKVLEVVPAGTYYQLTLQAVDSGQIIEIPVSPEPFHTDEEHFHKIERANLKFGAFDWAYAITVHCAQGGQWPRVMVIQEHNTIEKAGLNWVYTAITRASHQVLIIRAPKSYNW